MLQSDFFNAVREVYEHVYETVDIQGSPDIRASATAKATVAAFAASEGHVINPYYLINSSLFIYYLQYLVINI